jgi:O-antigen/teichoic acid export membrane protein
LIVNYLITITSAISGIISSVVVSKFAFLYLNESSLRLWFLLAATLPFISLLDLGALSVIPAEVATKKNCSLKLHSYIGSYLLVAVSGLFVFLILFCVMVHYDVLKTIDTYLLEIELFIFGVALRIFSNIIQAFLYSLDGNKQEKIIKIISTFVMTLLSCVLIISGLGLLSISIAWLASAITSIALTCYCLIKYHKIHFFYLEAKLDYTKEIIKKAGHYLSFAMPGLFIYSILPYYVALRLPAEYTIQFGLAQQISNAVVVFATLTTTIYIPKLAQIYVSNKIEARELLISNSIIVCSKITVLLIGIYLNIDLIMNMWIGRQFVFDKAFLLIYFIAVWFEVMQTTLTSASMAAGFTKYGLVTIMSAIILSMTIGVAITYFSFAGVAIAVLISQSLTCHFFNVRKALDLYSLRFSAYLNKLSILIFWFFIFIFTIFFLEQTKFASYVPFLNIFFWPIACFIFVKLIKKYKAFS